MKKLLRHTSPARVAVLLALGYSTCSHAQSSITLYGIVDAGVEYVSKVQNAGGGKPGSLLRLNSGGISGDRWGIRGAEDLGGGLSALVQLEQGFNIGSGMLAQGGREFGRGATVGLSDVDWGTLKAGRQTDTLYDLVGALTEDYVFNGTFATPGDIDNYDTDVRINNSLKYISPSVGGVVAEALYGFGGVPGSVGGGQTYSLAVSYHKANLSMAAGYFDAHSGPAGAGGMRTWSGSADSIFTSVVNSGFASASAVKIIRAGVQYRYRRSTFGIGYSNVEYSADGSSQFDRSARFNSGSVYLNYLASPQLQLGIGYSYTRSSSVASATYQQVNVASAYALSKRTDLYVMAGAQRATGTALVNGRIVPASAVIGSTALDSGGATQVLVLAGMRHRF